MVWGVFVLNDYPDEDSYYKRSGEKSAFWEIGNQQIDRWLTNIVAKIVPEHEAIHPCYYTANNLDYVAYVYKNKIMACEP